MLFVSASARLGGELVHRFHYHATGAYIFQRPFLRAYFWRGFYSEGLIYGGKLRFKIDWASLADRRKSTVFALFYLVF